MATLSKQTAVGLPSLPGSEMGLNIKETRMEPAKMRFWLKTELNNLHNKAGHFTSECKAPAFSELPGRTGEDIGLLFRTR